MNVKWRNLSLLAMALWFSGHRSRSLSLLLALDHQRASLAAFLELV